MTPFSAAPSLTVRILGQTDDPRLTRARRHAKQRAAARKRIRRQP
jgi:hypothetical protein